MFKMALSHVGSSAWACASGQDQPFCLLLFPWPAFKLHAEQRRGEAEAGSGDDDSERSLTHRSPETGVPNSTGEPERRSRRGTRTPVMPHVVTTLTPHTRDSDNHPRDPRA